MVNGKVKWFDSKKGYGFISQDNGNDVFVHFSSIKTEKDFKTLDKGQAVQFEVIDGKKGLQAINVSLV
jgi:CspA family cold shock protein